MLTALLLSVLSATGALPAVLAPAPSMAAQAAVPAGKPAAGPAVAPGQSAPAAPVKAAAPAKAAEDPALDGKLAAAGKDVTKLLALAAACSTAGQEDSAKKVFAKVLEVDAANETAHKGLRHQSYDGKWFDSFAELSKYKREEAAKMKAKGLARFKDGWVPEADVPFLKLGWLKGEGGGWVNPADKERAELAAERQKDGYEFRADDNSWIAPDDQDKWKGQLWKCGDEWLETPVADAYHAEIGKWWQLVGEHFEVWTTCDWDGGNWARWYADKEYPDLVRLFGIEPAHRPHFIVLNSLAQYNQASGANPPLIPESEGSSSVYGAYFADAYFDTKAKPPQYLGAGVSFWDRGDANLKAWGPSFLRWAAAQSYVDGIDPSWNSIANQISGGEGADAAAGANSFWVEKKVPRWLRYGAAAYAEGYMKNPDAPEGTDPWNLRAFTLGKLKEAGGLRKLDDVFKFQVNLKDAADASRLYHESGLLVSFLLDGAEGNKALAEKHAAFKELLQSGTKDEVAAAAAALQQELVKSEKEIRAFGGL